MLVAGAVAMAGVKAVGKYEQARQASEAEKANAEVLKTRAKEQQGVTKQQSTRLSDLRRRILGTQTAAYGASGVALTGSPIDVMANAQTQIERDILLSGYEGAKKTQAYQHASELMRWKAKQTMLGGYIKIVTGAMGAAGAAAIASGLGGNNLTQTDGASALKAGGWGKPGAGSSIGGVA